MPSLKKKKKKKRELERSTIDLPIFLTYTSKLDYHVRLLTLGHREVVLLHFPRPAQSARCNNLYVVDEALMFLMATAKAAIVHVKMSMLGWPVSETSEPKQKTT